MRTIEHPPDGVVAPDMVDDVLAELFSGSGEFPERVWLIHQGELYMSYMFRGTPGLACFSSEASARSFLLLAEAKADVTEVSFDDARDVALTKMVLRVLYLMDDPENPVVHHIR